MASGKNRYFGKVSQQVLSEVVDSKEYLQENIKNRPVVGERNSFKRNPFNTILFLKNKPAKQQLKKEITSRAA